MTLPTLLKNFLKKDSPSYGALEIIKYIGPGLVVTVGFTDPGNWASNIAAGSQFGYSLLWIVTLSTIMLIFLQHNAAHLGIATGLCLSEAMMQHLKPWIARLMLASAMAASIATALAEILGAAIGLQMITGLPLPIGAVLSTILVGYLLLSNNYRRLEKYIIGFVSLIGLSFLFELSLVDVAWVQALRGWLMPQFPAGSLPIIMSVLGAVVMPHNIYLHSEIIQSRQLNRENPAVIEMHLRLEIWDTILAMGVGWVINSAIIIVAATTFFQSGIAVTELPQAQATLKPLLGNAAAMVFAAALLMAGISSAVTAAMAGGSIFAGLFDEPYNIDDRHSRTGVLITLIGGLLSIFLFPDPFKGLIWSQIILSIQLPWTVIGLVFLTSSKRVMGGYANAPVGKSVLVSIAVIIVVLNVLLFLDLLGVYKL